LAKLGDSTCVFKTINDYLITLYDDGELSSKATIRKFQIVQTEGNRQVSRLVDPYRLEAILSVAKRGDCPRVLFRIPNKTDAAIEYFRLIDFEREGLEKYAFEGPPLNVRELLNGLAPVAPIQKSEDRRSDLHIYASDRTNVQVINGNDNNTSGSHNRTAQGISLPIVVQPKPFWQKLAAPIAVLLL
jgi:hypothetical protein